LLAFQVHSFRSLASDGEIARYNFHQFLGIPAVSGCGGPLYPPALAAVWLSLKIFGHYWAAMDVLCSFHMLGAAAGMFVLASSMGMAEETAFFAACLWAFSPVVIFSGASWWNVLDIACWFPWLLCGAARMFSRRDAMSVMLVALPCCLMLLTNHPQYPIYAMISAGFFAFAIAAREFLSAEGGKLQAGYAARFFINYRAELALFAASAAAGCLLAMPSLLPLWGAMRESASRSVSLGFTEFSSFNLRFLEWGKGLFWPYTPQNPDSLYHYAMDKQAFLGYVPLCLLAVLWFKRKALGKWRTMSLACAFCAGFCLLWALGCFNPVEYFIPFLNRLRWHFKILFFADFFLLLLAAVASEVFLAAKGRKALLWTLIVLHCALMAGFYWRGPRVTFRLHTEAIPAHEELAAQFAHSRVEGLGWPIFAPQGMPGLLFDYPTLYGLYGFAGYDTLVPAPNFAATYSPQYTGAMENMDKAKLDAMRLWGVRWHLVEPKYIGRCAQFFMENGVALVSTDAKRMIFEDDSALPLVRSPDGTAVDNWDACGNHLRARLPDAGGGVYILSWLYRKGFSAVSDTGAACSVAASPQGQIVVTLPPGAKGFDLSWRNPLLRPGFALAGFGAALLCAVALLAGAGRAKRLE